MLEPKLKTSGETPSLQT